MVEVWGSNEVSEREVRSDLNTYVRVNGSTLPVEVGSSFKDVVKEMSLNAGFGKFRVYLNGTEVKPSMAPESISLGDKVEIRAYDEAGLV